LAPRARAAYASRALAVKRAQALLDLETQIQHHLSGKLRCTSENRNDIEGAAIANNKLRMSSFAAGRGTRDTMRPMRQSISFLALFLLGCPAPYGLKLTVNVPTDVQAAFSAAQPGLVMFDDRAVALLCDPTDKPLTFVTSPESGHTECERPQTLPLTIYAFRLGPTDLQSLTPLQEMFVTCGKSAKIADSGSIDAIADLVQKDNLGVKDRVASAAGDGACDSSGNWNVDLTLSLLP
jgi:hypothetical protein